MEACLRLHAYALIELATNRAQPQGSLALCLSFAVLFWFSLLVSPFCFSVLLFGFVCDYWMSKRGHVIGGLSLSRNFLFANAVEAEPY